MNRFSKIILFSILFLNGICFSSAQELPPVTKYKSQMVNAGNQNWMISQDFENYIYIANNEGLLEFNGSYWHLYPSPNETIIRSVNVVGTKIYTGSYMEFGYWERQSNGLLAYFSISSKIKDKLINDEHFWNILNVEHWMIFQSFNRIYIYDTDTQDFKFIDNHSYIFKCYIVDNSVYYQAMGEGLFEIVNGMGKLVSDNDILKNNRIVEIFKEDGFLLLQTERAGAFKFEGGKLSSFVYASENELKWNTVYSAQKLSDGGFALGSISNGIFILDSKGLIKYHITQKSGLSNNTILSIMEDMDNNLWLGLDNGVDCINLRSPITSYVDDLGVLGTVYASIKYGNIIYIGTNQGLYYKNASSQEGFKLVNGTKGQVWNLFEFENTLFCGHDLGTFIVEGNNAKLIYSESGTWKINPIPNRNDVLMQGGYTGLSILEKKNNQWVFRNKIKGFDISSRYFEIAIPNSHLNVKNENLASYNVYVGHEYKGVLKLDLDSDFIKTAKIHNLKKPAKGIHLSLISYNGSIYFANRQGIFKLNKETNEFELDENLSDILKGDEYVSGKLNVDASNRMWFFTKKYIYFFNSGNFNESLKKHRIPISYSYINAMLGYENITQIANEEYLIGKTDGYLIINLKQLNLKNNRVSISKISLKELGKPIIYLPISEGGDLSHNQNNVTFNFSVPQYRKFIIVEYQYILEGFHEQWSPLNSTPSVSFENLAPGKYTFKVRAKIANGLPENIASYDFEIRKPWYLTNFAIVLYSILLVLIIYFVHKAYKIHYQEQQEHLIEENNRLLEIKELENEQELMKLKNEQLEQDVDSKSRELAVSTINLIKKNELLTLIKEDLKKTAEDKKTDLKSVITKINRNITEDNTWNLFKESYDNLDHDFLKRMKNTHPSLTPSDLKLCAYLRLNLSSKEIAPMLHISIRSVEIKRYRLRKKLELNHDDGLLNYILSF